MRPAPTDRSDDETPGPLARRALLGGGLAAAATAAAVMLADDGPASAANGAPVIIGADNIASDQTLVRNTAAFPINGNRAIFAACTTMVAGIGVEASGSRSGILAVGRNDQSHAPSSGASGVEAITFSPSGYGAVLNAGSGLAPVRIVPMTLSGQPSAGTHGAGELVVDRDGRFFACTTSGTPGTWVELTASPIAPVPTTTLTLLPATERFVDTRTGLGGVSGPVPAGSTKQFTITGRPGQSNDPARIIPDGAIAVAANITAVGDARARAGSTLTVGTGGKQPPPPTLFFGPAGLTGPVANGALLALAPAGSSGAVVVTNSASCDYSIDVTGYYTPT